MNFRTTLILLILLAAVGSIVLFTRNAPEKAEAPAEHKLLDIASADVQRVKFTGDDGKATALERADGKWRLSEPVNAPADEFAASGLVDALTGLISRGQVDVGAGTGLDSPRFKIEIRTSAGKTIQLDVGERSGAGDNLYVHRAGEARADVVAASLLETLDKPLKEFRQAKLLEVAANDVKQIRVATTQQTLSAEKVGETWRITEPSAMPADSAAVSDLAMAASNLRAEEFVDSTADEAKRFGLDAPVMTVTLSTSAPVIPPATQPASAPTPIVITFGRFDDILKKNVYAKISTEPGIVKVSAATLESFRKKPLDLRDKAVLNIDPEKVTRVSLMIDKPATTQPTTRAASQTSANILRVKQHPATEPATEPATAPTTEPTTATSKPAPKPAKWSLGAAGDAEEMKVDQLLAEFHPLRASRFLDSLPSHAPLLTAKIEIESTDAVQTLTVIDPGENQPLLGQSDGLSFELDRALLEKIEGDFARQK